MRKLLSAAAFAGAATMSVPLAAQDYADEYAPVAQSGDLASLSEKLGDPDKQYEMAMMIQTMTEVLLDLPLAPLAEAAAEIAGEDPARVDPNLTLRSLSPQSSDVPEKVGRAVPRAMGAVAGMAKGFEAMLPALREMADRMEEAASDY
ncbi:hypothetical protein [Qipengyuania atrilutea]|uniref:Uncharacterized protein n=1 Tax=Qipengyuania atrilutea TaxID=2744473 RepID=A0A850H8G2_9SPHN|nr:hypothetical protein [Actirhodobacter atriluteus]NVD46083.1 hypothetical protein [Actirhodobacter atriluteus]